MAGRKTPKDNATSAEAPETTPDTAETAKTPATEPEKTLSEGATPPPEPEEDAASEPMEEPAIESREPTGATDPTELPDEGTGPAVSDDVPPEDLPPEDPPVEERPAPEAPAPVVVKRGPGFVPLFFGGVVAAALGFGAGQYVNKGWPFAARNDATAQLKSTLDRQQKDIAALQQKLDQTAKAAADASARAGKLDSDLGKRLDDQKKTFAAGIQTNTLAISELKSGLSGIKTQASSAQGTLPKATQDEIGQLEQRVNKLETDVQNRLDAARKSADEEKARAEAEAKLARERAAVTQIEAALNAGGGYADAVSVLSAGGVDVPEALSGTAQNGVPTMAALRQAFDPAARDALTASVRGKVNGGVWDRVTAFLQVQTGARSLTPRQGDSPDAVLSRARADVEKGDLSAAIETIKSLPEPGQQAMSDWVKRVQTRLKAQAAARKIGAALANQPNGK
ncbi:mitofilin family membrane protein [Acidimangrovimonas sediminis]|uniref:mitofilin family membrane protein n=1 Tax=Acidimangrovimonas sediminis TaxID=2056283 RepID=UPI001E2FF669|nr:mitofilin family membrane protein [Acidimangrovimonas sediminis]